MLLGPRQPDQGTRERFQALLGRVPKEGDTVAYGGWRFEVVDMDGRRIDKVLVRRPTAREEDPAAKTA